MNRCVIYRDGDYWVAHSLRYDQLGVAEDVVGAIIDLCTAVAQIQQLAAEDPTVQVECEAPPEIQALWEKATQLPREFLEIAHKRMTGEWPTYIDVTVNDSDTPYAGTLEEIGC